MAALKDTESPVRRKAAWALGAIGDDRAAPGLVRAEQPGCVMRLRKA